MFILIVGCGRVGSSVARTALRDGHTVSCLDEDPESHARLEVGLEKSWEDLGGQFTVGTGLELEALTEAGIENADAFIASTDGDNTNIIISQIAQKRFNVVTVIESNRRRYLTVEQELEHNVQYGDASELWVLERAGIQRADMVIAVTGDDEDNMLICQVAREKYLVDQIIARVNNPRNRRHFDLLGVKPFVSATDLILRLLEHEVPEYGLVHLLDLPEERLEIIEMLLGEDSKAAGQRVG